MTSKLVETLELERIEVNLFRGYTPDRWKFRIFGGQVIAQSLLAASETVENRVCHSLHAYFIRPGDPEVPIVFQVDRSRDGGSFTTRRVIAVQHGHQIFNMSASFMAPEEGRLQHQLAMPDVPGPDELPDQREVLRKAARNKPGVDDRLPMQLMEPVEIRHVDAVRGKPARGETTEQIWFRAREPVGDNRHMHQVALAYASDMNLLGTAFRPHEISWDTPGLQMASLDHAMWFHGPVNFNDWHLYAMESPWAGQGRGLTRASIFAQDGTLVASVAQEGLMRFREPKK